MIERFVAALCLLGAVAAPTRAACRVEIETAAGAPAVFMLEVARTPETRALGLMGRTSLPPQGGMLFDFGVEDRPVFWMRNTPVALDILFVSSALRVVNVVADATPNSEQLLPATSPARYAVEVAAGETARLGVVPGARISLPAGYPAACP